MSDELILGYLRVAKLADGSVLFSTSNYCHDQALSAGKVAELMSWLSEQQGARDIESVKITITDPDGNSQSEHWPVIIG